MDFDWNSLEELRASYLDGTAGTTDYWSSDSLLVGYDATFARRIAWKWQWVLRELDRIGWKPPGGTVLDFGCGTGVAMREYLGHFRHMNHATAAFMDRSSRALRFAANATRREFPGVVVPPLAPEVTDVLLVSHVIPELDENGLTKLLAVAATAQVVIFVEPGTREVSRKLIAVREKLRETHRPVAPCVHTGACGMLTAGNERHWCHFFAQPPNEVFTDGDWVIFGREMGIDLRSLPLSFLVMDRRGPATLPLGSVRMIGTPRLYKGYALLHGCDAAGVEEKRLNKRVDPAFFKALDKDRAPTLQCWHTQKNDIVQVTSSP